MVKRCFFAEALADVLQAEQGIGCLCHEIFLLFGQKQPDTIVFLIAEMLHPRQKLTDLKLCQLTAHLFNQSSIFG